MKKFLVIITIASIGIACTRNGKVDEKEIDAAGKKIQTEVKKGVDTVGSKLKKLKNKIEDENKDKDK